MLARLPVRCRPNQVGQWSSSHVDAGKCVRTGQTWTVFDAQPTAEACCTVIPADETFFAGAGEETIDAAEPGDEEGLGLVRWIEHSINGWTWMSRWVVPRMGPPTEFSIRGNETKGIADSCVSETPDPAASPL